MKRLIYLIIFPPVMAYSQASIDTSNYISSDSLYCYTIDTLQWADPAPIIRLLFDKQQIVIYVEKDSLILDLKNKRVFGNAEMKLAADQFMKAILMVYDEQYKDQWNRIMYLEESYWRYYYILSEKHRKALELYLEQEGYK